MSTEARVTTLEQAMADLAVAQARTQRNLDQFSQELRQALAASAQELRQELAASAQELRQEMARVSTQMGQLSNKMGTLVEDIVAPGVPEVFSRFFGVEDPDSLVHPRPRDSADPSRRREFDLVAWGGDVFLINETRSRLTPKDIDDLVELLPQAKRFFRDAEGKGVVGSLAAFDVDPSLVAAAERRGLLVFGLGQGLLEILNHPGFEPRRF